MADEHLNLILQAQTAQWNAAFAQMQAAAGSLGSTVASVTIKMNEVEKAAKKAKEEMKWSDVVTGLNQAYELVSKFVGKAVELAHFSAEMKNLEARVPVERLKMMQEATEGAVKKADLMRFSMRALGGEMHLTEAGLDKVLKAANTLGDKGFGDTMKNAEKLLDALHKGSSKELREFGIALKDTADKHENVNNLMKEFAKLAKESPPVDESLKEIERVQTAWADFIDDVKKGLGSIIIQIGQGIAELLGLMDPSKARKLAMRSAEITLQKTGTLEGSGIPGMPDFSGEWQRDKFMMTPEQIAAAEQKQRATYWSTQVALMQGLGHAVNEQKWVANEAAQRAAMNPANYLGGARQGIATSGADLVNTQSRGTPAKDKTTPWWTQLAFNTERDTSFVRPDLAKLGRGALSTLGWAGVGDSGQRSAGMDFISGGSVQAANDLSDKEEQLRDFNTQIADSTTMVGAGYKVMTSAAQAAVEAAISGSESLAAAARKASAAALKSIALEAAAKAVFSIAEAIFTRDPTKLIAAAEYATAATLAAAGAAALGGGGGGGSTAGTGRRTTATALPGGGYASAGGGGGGGGSTNISIYVGDGFVGKPDELAVAIADKLAHGVQSGSVRNIAQTQPGAVTFRS